MGVSLSWIGVEGTPPSEVLMKLGLSETGMAGGYYNFPIAGLALPTGWYLLTAKPCDHPILSDRILCELSAGARVIACAIEEHVMYQMAALWSDGKETCSVQHRGGDHGIMDLVVKGAPPKIFEDLRAQQFARQSEAGGADTDVDYIAEIPLELARSVVGFKHDEINPAIDDRSFRELQQGRTGLLAEAAKPRWKFW
jgi:hypothetical protein